MTSGDQEPEEFTGLTMAPGPQNVVTTVNTQSKYVRLEEVNAALPDLRRAPAAGEYSLAAANGEELTVDDVTGDVSRRTGMDGLAAIDEITMLCVPDLMAFAADNDDVLRDLQGKMITHCENAGDRMAILDPPPRMLPPEVLEWRMNTAGYDSKFATLYYPWIEVLDPSSQPVMVPPCGHVAGLWARTDSTRGVHKAPANEVVRRANGLGFQITSAEQGELNKNGVNCIRSFPGRGIRVWGARTLSSDPEWRYINVRRLVNYISESIMEGTQWAVFEPNDSRLWMQLRISTSNFLTRVWRDGALFGASPDQAFYVKCDEETNPPDLVEAGQVTIEIGHRAGQAGGVHRLPYQPVPGRCRRGRLIRVDQRGARGCPMRTSPAVTTSAEPRRRGGRRVLQGVHRPDERERGGRARRPRTPRASRSSRSSRASMKWSNITLKRGIDTQMELWQWRKDVIDGKINASRKDGTIQVVDWEGTPVMTFKFIRAWPCRYSSPGLNAGGNEILVEELELAHEGFERERPDADGVRVHAAPGVRRRDRRRPPRGRHAAGDGTRRDRTTARSVRAAQRGVRDRPAARAGHLAGSGRSRT